MGLLHQPGSPSDSDKQNSHPHQYLPNFLANSWCIYSVSSEIWGLFVNVACPRLTEVWSEMAKPQVCPDSESWQGWPSWYPIKQYTLQHSLWRLEGLPLSYWICLLTWFIPESLKCEGFACFPKWSSLAFISYAWVFQSHCPFNQEIEKESKSHRIQGACYICLLSVSRWLGDWD